MGWTPAQEGPSGQERHVGASHRQPLGSRAQRWDFPAAALRLCQPPPPLHLDFDSAPQEAACCAGWWTLRGQPWALSLEEADGDEATQSSVPPAWPDPAPP